jgi:hypothetical protein
MNALTAPAPAWAPLRLPVHLLVAATVGIVAPFTALAWPFALLAGMILGSADARRERGEPDGAADTIASSIIVALLILAMLFFGAIVGGIIAFAVIALASFAERAAAHASPTDRGVARILLFVVPIAMWFVVFPLLGLNVDIRIGS